MKHFKLTEETKVNAFGVTLFRIELTVDCKWGKVGDKGGWIEKEDNLSGDAMVYGDAWVSGNARVYGNAEVSGNARVYGNAEVSGGAWVSGNARVSGNAWVYGNASVYGNAMVSGNARVSGNAMVSGNAWEKSPLQIQGTKHFFNICAKSTIKIGCHKNTIAWWLENYKTVGEQNGYTESEIREYGLYIQLAKDLES